VTPERVLWWIVLLWAIRYAWRVNAKADRLGRADTSGTRTLELGARKLEELVRFAGPERLEGQGPGVVSWETEVGISGQRYRLKLERRIWETE